MKKEKLVNCGNYFTQERFEKLCEEIEKGEPVNCYIECIGFTRAHNEGLAFRNAVKEKYGDKVEITENEHAHYSDWSYQMKEEKQICKELVPQELSKMSQEQISDYLNNRAQKMTEIFEKLVGHTFCNYDETNWFEASLKDSFEDEIDLVRKALERSVAKRPHVHNEPVEPIKERGNDYLCPSCEDYVYLEEWAFAYEKPNFCSRCGKALDWGDE